MFKIKVDKEQCKGCGLCIEVCPGKILHLSSSFNQQGQHFVKVINEEKCTGCKKCVIICPDVAIEIYKTGSETQRDRDTK
jgi:2-oxoglutarate ferredoxin oxidoreductase subunit delta